jgi:hypothetical protein
MKIDKIPVTTESILKTYRRYYPNYFKQISDANKFQFLLLWGVRVSTCDTSLPDDVVGGLRVNNLNFWESVISDASTEPSPALIAKPLSDAKKLGGAAFVKEGQYGFKYIGTNHLWRPYPAFCPTKPMDVYRYVPTAKEIADWKANKIPLSSVFNAAVKPDANGKTRAILSKSPDTCIHRAYSKNKFYNDSAGCQILTNYDSLKKLGTWANEHIAKKYGNSFIYTLFTKEQFVTANKTNITVPTGWWRVF